MKSIRSPFGKGPDVSIFTLGTMRATDSAQQMEEILEESISAGINHLETAPAYGHAENFIGNAIKNLKNKKLEPEGGWVITSKILPGASLNEGKNQLLGIIKRIGLKKIDNLAIHGINLEEHLDWTLSGAGASLIEWAKNENLITQVGFSSHGSIQLIKAAITSKVFSFCSLHLHLLDPERIPLAKKAIKNGLGVMAISPADKGGHLHSPSETLIQDCHPFRPLELAYRYLLAEGISTLTVGASKPQDLQLVKKLRSANGPLDINEKEALANLKKNFDNRLGKTKCNQCRSCLPCSKQVPITDLLRLRNIAIGHGLHGFAKERYNLIGKAGHWWESIDASACENCQDCLPRCPYNLNIPSLLKETHNLLVSSQKRRLWG